MHILFYAFFLITWEFKLTFSDTPVLCTPTSQRKHLYFGFETVERIYLYYNLKKVSHIRK